MTPTTSTYPKDTRDEMLVTRSTHRHRSTLLHLARHNSDTLHPLLEGPYSLFTEDIYMWVSTVLGIMIIITIKTSYERIRSRVRQELYTFYLLITTCQHIVSIFFPAFQAGFKFIIESKLTVDVDPCCFAFMNRVVSKSTSKLRESRRQLMKSFGGVVGEFRNSQKSLMIRLQLGSRTTDQQYPLLVNTPTQLVHLTQG